MLRRAGWLGVVVVTLAACTAPAPDPVIVTVPAQPVVHKAAPPAPAAVTSEPDVIEPDPEPAIALETEEQTLVRASLTAILPDGLPQAATATGLTATPRGHITIGFTAPDEQSVIELADDQHGMNAVWAVTDRAPGWVQVLVPFGRGALPSEDATRTNGVAAWVRAEDVTVADGARSAVVDLSARTLTLDDGSVFPVSVGRNATPTPTGLCAVAGLAHDPHMESVVLVTSCQSEAMDEFSGGSGYAVIGLHAGTGIGQAVSNGCIRLPADGAERVLATLTPGSTLLIQ